MQAIVSHIKDGQFRNDATDCSLGSKGQRALFNNLWLPILKLECHRYFGQVLHGHQDSWSFAGCQIHGPTHSLQHLPRNRPTGQIPLSTHLHPTQNGQIQVATNIVKFARLPVDHGK